MKPVHENQSHLTVVEAVDVVAVAAATEIVTEETAEGTTAVAAVAVEETDTRRAQLSS
jgi:uncharacterized protein YjdB